MKLFSLIVSMAAVAGLIACSTTNSTKNTSTEVAKTTNTTSTRSIASTPPPNGYDGPAVDVNFINTKPAKYAICDQYVNDTFPGATRRYSACEFARDEAERMADRYGGGNGRIQGFLKGYSWGMYKNAQVFSADGNAMGEGENAVNGMGTYMQSGLDAGIATGKSEGNSSGRTDAINRFEAVVDRNANPDATLRVPATNYQGIDDGYAKLVGPVPSVQDIIKNEVHLEDLPVYNYSDATYLGEVKPVSIWDLWFDDGVYVFEKSQWFDKDLAYKVWQERPIDTKPKYEALNNPPLVIPATPTTPAQTVDLKAVFASVFKESYAYYINYYFSKTFYENLDLGQFNGMQIGEQIGKRVAYYRGLEKAFNKKYKESSAATYRDAFVDAYTTSFNATFTDYQNNPKLNSLKLDSIIGEVNDGIIQPGEMISAKFSIRNSGGVGTTLTAGISGNVTDQTTQNFNMAKLVTFKGTTSFIARVDNRLNPGETANLKLTVNGLSDGIGQPVQRTLSIMSVAPKLDIINGSGTIHVTIQNVATVNSSSNVKVSLKLNGRDTDTQLTGSIQSGATDEVVLRFSNVDPFLFLNGSVEAKITLIMDDKTMESKTTNLKTSNKEYDAINYWNQLVNDKGFIPASVEPEARINAVHSMIVKMNNEEMLSAKGTGNKGNLWKHQPDETVVGKLVHFMKITDQTDSSKSRYGNLSQELWGARKTFKRFLFIGAKRKAYDKLCKELATLSGVSLK